jgi:hypothetical protein
VYGAVPCRFCVTFIAIPALDTVVPRRPFQLTTRSSEDRALEHQRNFVNNFFVIFALQKLEPIKIEEGVNLGLSESAVDE